MRVEASPLLRDGAKIMERARSIRTVFKPALRSSPRRVAPRQTVMQQPTRRIVGAGYSIAPPIV